MMTQEQITQMFNEDSDDDEFLGLLINLPILVHLIHTDSTLGCIGPKTRCVLYTRAAYNRVYTVYITFI